MSTYTESNKRIAKNTLLLYGRMLFSMLVSLYTSRVILSALGAEDFGIYNVVAGFVIMFSLVSGTLSSSVSRFLTFELGTGNEEKLKNIFSTSLIIHLLLSAVILLALETVGLWFLNYKMTIPTERMVAANWVFQTAVISFVINIIGVPYNASIVAQEKFDVYAYLGIIQVLLLLFAVLFIAYSPYSFDKLIMYGLFNVLISGLLQGYTVYYSQRKFKEARFNLSFDKNLFREMASFAGWNFIGSTAGLLKDQGVNILLNLFGGPVINAARGIAGSLSGATTKLSASFMTALNPQITKSYAAGNKEHYISITERGSRFSFYAMFLLALPIFIEIHFILRLWLNEYPPHTANFARLFLILMMIEVLSSTLITLQSATGKIRNYQIVVGGALLMNFPLSYIVLKMGFPSESTFIVAIFVAIVCLLLRLWFLRTMAQLPMRGYIKRVVVNVLTVVIVSSVIPVLLYFVFHDCNHYLRFSVTLFSSLTTTSIAVLYIGCSCNERNFLLSKIKGIRNRFKRIIYE